MMELPDELHDIYLKCHGQELKLVSWLMHHIDDTCSQFGATLELRHDRIDRLTAEVTNLRELASMVWVNSSVANPVGGDYIVASEHLLALRDYVQNRGQMEYTPDDAQFGDGYGGD